MGFFGPCSNHHLIRENSAPCERPHVRVDKTRSNHSNLFWFKASYEIWAQCLALNHYILPALRRQRWSKTQNLPSTSQFRRNSRTNFTTAVHTPPLINSQMSCRHNRCLILVSVSRASCLREGTSSDVWSPIHSFFITQEYMSNSLQSNPATVFYTSRMQNAF